MKQRNSWYSINFSDNDKSFDKLKELQTLLKKESSLKELCK